MVNRKCLDSSRLFNKNQSFFIFYLYKTIKGPQMAFTTSKIGSNRQNGIRAAPDNILAWGARKK